jgi:hypothetical protein
MRVEVVWTVSSADVGEQSCAICGGRFWLGSATAQAVSDSEGAVLGEVCPACLSAGPEHMTRELELRARWSRLQAEWDEAIAAEPFSEDCPTLDEYLALEAALGAPLHATLEEAEALEAASAEGEPGCACSPAGRRSRSWKRTLGGST